LEAGASVHFCCTSVEVRSAAPSLPSVMPVIQRRGAAAYSLVTSKSVMIFPAASVNGMMSDSSLSPFGDSSLGRLTRATTGTCPSGFSIVSTRV
jgi:hypothetical protein